MLPAPEGVEMANVFTFQDLVTDVRNVIYDIICSREDYVSLVCLRMSCQLLREDAIRSLASGRGYRSRSADRYAMALGTYGSRSTFMWTMDTFATNTNISPSTQRDTDSAPRHFDLWDPGLTNTPPPPRGVVSIGLVKSYHHAISSCNLNIVDLFGIETKKITFSQQSGQFAVTRHEASLLPAGNSKMHVDRSHIKLTDVTLDHVVKSDNLNMVKRFNIYFDAAEVLRYIVKYDSKVLFSYYTIESHIYIFDTGNIFSLILNTGAHKIQDWIFSLVSSRNILFLDILEQSLAEKLYAKYRTYIQTLLSTPHGILGVHLSPKCYDLLNDMHHFHQRDPITSFQQKAIFSDRIIHLALKTFSREGLKFCRSVTSDRDIEICLATPGSFDAFMSQISKHRGHPDIAYFIVEMSDIIARVWRNYADTVLVGVAKYFGLVDVSPLAPQVAGSPLSLLSESDVSTAVDTLIDSFLKSRGVSLEEIFHFQPLRSRTTLGSIECLIIAERMLLRLSRPTGRSPSSRRCVPDAGGLSRPLDRDPSSISDSSKSPDIEIGSTLEFTKNAIGIIAQVLSYTINGFYTHSAEDKLLREKCPRYARCNECARKYVLIPLIVLAFGSIDEFTAAGWTMRFP